MRLKEDIILREEEQEGLLFEQATGRIFILNYTGLIAAKMLEKSTSPEGLVNGLCKVYKHIKKEELASDLNQFLDGLRKRNMLVE